MTIIAIANGAGSAAKTTSAVTLAAIAAEEGRTVRLVDLDPQANATHWTSPVDDWPKSITGVIEQTASVRDVEVAIRAHPGLTLVPADRRNMSGLEAGLARSFGAEQRLRVALEAADPVDLTIIDCPGSLGILTVSAMVAADSVLTVAMPTVKELSGLPNMRNLVDQVRVAYNPRLTIAGVIPCAVPPYNAGRHYVDALGVLAQQWSDKVTPQVGRSVTVPESYAARIPLPSYAPLSRPTGSYREVFCWLRARRLL